MQVGQNKHGAYKCYLCQACMKNNAGSLIKAKTALAVVFVCDVGVSVLVAQ